MSFTYMGTKKPIVGEVAKVVALAKSGPFLDLFAGISSVGTEVANKRQVWCNDVQSFAATVAKAKFTSLDGPALPVALLSRIMALAQHNREKCDAKLKEWIVREQVQLHEEDTDKLIAFVSRQLKWTKSRQAYALRDSARVSPIATAYCLFSTSYVGGYFGAKQANDIDCLKFAVHHLRSVNEISEEQHRWFDLALCKTLFSIANTTGHFAQFLGLKHSNARRFLLKRRRDVVSEWIEALSQLSPVGTSEWRSRNRVFHGDASNLLADLAKSGQAPAVIYADPPYTSDQYSRYYHLLETAILYDYPTLSGKGQYRPHRFVSKFSLRSQVQDAFDELISNAASLGSELIINYPEAGLLPDTKRSILKALKKRFSKAELAAEIHHEHSTLGASKGVERAPVKELLFHAR